MPLTRIDSKDFVFNNDDISTSCWRDENGNPVGDPTTPPTFNQQSISYTVNTAIGTVTNYYIGPNPANLQFSRTSANKNGNDYQQAVYGAIRNIVLGDVNADITWNNLPQPQFNVISISKNVSLPLLPGSIKILNITDDSNITPPRILNCGRAYDLRPAPNLPGGGYALGYGTGTSFGLFLPDVGLILLSGFFSSNFALSTLNPTPTNHVFIRARNTQYNYSTNPSFISGSSGYIINKDWYNNPQTYITTVGLYNDNNELMATAKLPRPYNKNFNNELLIQVGLNF
jgi:hypothetical protein